MGLYPRLFLEPMHCTVQAWLAHIKLATSLA
jgi:hypothetical protein